VNAGAYHTCGVTMTGRGFCWGLNGNGRIGDGTLVDRLTPMRLGTDLELRQIGAGQDHTCGVTAGGTAYCWGANGGRIGDGTTRNRLWPTAVVAPL
jgi:alpha-tubulin suppressor-like RCC1 family protein